MKKLDLALCVISILFAPVFVGTAAAQVQWNATSSPAQSTIAGGPWTLDQGQSTTGGTSGPYDGPIPYCTPGSANGGTGLVNSSSVVNTFHPYYFPLISGRGPSVKGYFDYRPKNINEAIVTATTADAGKTWQFQQMVEQLTTLCPASDSNSGGTDDGEGHPAILSFGGINWLLTLDRRAGHVDSDGLIVRTLRATGSAPLNPLPATNPFNQPPTSNVIAGWNFNNVTNDASGFALNPAPSTNNSAGTPAAQSLGMTNNYVYSTTPPTTGSVDGSNVTNTTLSSDPSGTAAHNIGPNNNPAWRVVGEGGTAGVLNAGNGWNLSAPPCTQGAQFMVNTTGFHYIVLQFDWYTTNQGVRDLQVRYTTNGGAIWTPVGPIQVSGGGSTFNNQITIDFHALGITSVENNPNFGVQMVSVFDPDYQGTPAYSIPVNGTPCSSGATGTYTAATLSATTGQPVVYNNNSGNWRFDEVNILGTTNNTNPITNDPIVNTTGLVNPDGILAVVPGTYPIKVLYVSKTLNSDFVPPTNYPQCVPPPGVGINHDVEVVRVATTTNGVNFTDITPTNAHSGIPMVNGLSDPTTISYSGIRYPSPSGTLFKLSTGNWGLFFGGGNCLDGDSDAFHAIMYAESPDLINWTVINGLNNPIASIDTVTATDPVSQQSVTIPAIAPVVGATQAWFGGRVYAPQAIWTSPGTVSLIFAGYDTGYAESGTSKDLSSYRNIGQVSLSASGASLQ
jgi:hypothetical protein